MEECKKLSSMLAIYAPKEINTWILRYDVAIRRGKALICLQALRKARAIDPDNSALFARIVDFEKKRGGFSGMSPVVSKILEEEAPALVEKRSFIDFVKSAVERVRGSASADLLFRTEVAKAMVECQVGSPSEAAELVTKDGLGCKNVSVETCQTALKVLNGLGDGAAKTVADWKALVKAKYPSAACFACDIR